MKRFILTVAAIGMMVVGAGAVVITPVIPSLEQGADCYLIGTAAELYGFANIVNGYKSGSDSISPNPSACGKLTEDIDVNSNVLNSEGVLNSGYSYSNVQDAFYHWENHALIDFTGSFDGSDKTISGLYCGVGDKCGFFKTVGAGAEIRNVKIVDTYMNVDRIIAGGLIAEIAAGEGSVTIDNCSFSGTITGSSWAEGSQTSYLAGLVGKVTSGTVSISNSSVSGRIVAADVTSNNTSQYEIETIITAKNVGALIGGVEEGASVTVTNSSAQNVTMSVADEVKKGDETLTSSNVGGVVGNSESSSVTLNGVTCEESSGCVGGKDISEVNAGLKGVVLRYSGSKLIATLYDDVAELVIPQDVPVDSVELARVFTANAPSTILFPFATTTDKVKGGTLNRLTNVTQENGVYKKVSAQAEDQAVSAYAPYFVTPTGTELNVLGGVTLKATVESNYTMLTPKFDGNQWQFFGTVAKKRWENNAKGTPENADEIGRVYGFAGSDPSKTDYEIGSFVKAKNKVSIRPMRAYLMYIGALPQGKPAELGASYAPAAETASISNLPDSLKVVIVDAEEPEEEEITSMQTLKVPANIVKSDRWHDVVGRSMNKPKAQGAYLNNRTPVIVK